MEKPDNRCPKCGVVLSVEKEVFGEEHDSSKCVARGWEDTIMRDPANLEWTETPSGNYAADFSFVDDYRKEVKVICETQAEISFKAGIRAMVEWFEGHLINTDDRTFPDRVLTGADYQRLQTKLKKWGMKEKKDEI